MFKCDVSFRGTLYNTQEVAVKKLRIHSIDDKQYSEFRREVKIMRMLRHPNVVEFLGACVDVDGANLCIITEYLANGSIEDVLARMARANPPKKLSIAKVISFSKDIARALNWLHHKGIIHRDLVIAHPIHFITSHSISINRLDLI